MPNHLLDRLARGALAVTVALAFFVPLGWLVFHWDSQRPKVQIQMDAYVVPPGNFKPEPAERTVYMLAMPFFFGAIFLLTRALGGCSKISQSLSSRLRFAGLCALGAWCAFFILSLVFDSRFDLDYGTILHLNAIWEATPLWLVFCYWVYVRWLGSNPVRRVRFSGAFIKLAWGVATAAILFIGLSGLFCETSPHVRHAHFGAIFDSASQASQGKVILKDFTNQYGLYAQLITPILRPLSLLLGSEIAAFSVLFASLTSLAFAPIILFLRRVVANRLIRVISLLALLQWCGVSGRLMSHQSVGWFDPYFQYVPIRTLMPCLLIGFHTFYFNRPTHFKYWGAWGALAVGVLWNLDSGIVAFLAWAMTLGFDEALRLKQGFWRMLANFVTHLARGALVMAVVAALYSVVITIALGATPDFRSFGVMQKAFYLDGAFMLPMKLFSVWNLWAAVFLAGIAFSAAALRKPATDLRTRSVFLLSIMGIGLFSYFQGRSHPYNLMGMSYILVLLIALFADGLQSARDKTPAELRKTSAALLLPLMLCLLCSLALSGMYQTPMLATKVIQGWMRPLSENELSLKREWDFLRALPGLEKRGTCPLLALSNYSAAIHSVTETPAPTHDSFYEFVSVSELDAIVASIHQGDAKYVVVSRAFETAAGWNPAFHRACAALDESGSFYSFRGKSPGGLFKVYEKTGK